MHTYPRRWESDSPEQVMYIEQATAVAPTTLVYHNGDKLIFGMSVRWLEKHRKELLPAAEPPVDFVIPERRLDRRRKV